MKGNDRIVSVINEITATIIKNAKDGESIRSLARRIGFAYSAVYHWINEMERYGIVDIIKKGNKNVIKISNNNIYIKFNELNEAISVITKDKLFWNLMKKTKLKIRFVQGTAVAIWTKGSFITGDFANRIYFLEVKGNSYTSLKKTLNEYGIKHIEKGKSSIRPLVYIIKKKNFNIERKNNLPTMPLNELILWCKRLYLENILEKLNLIYDLGLSEKYSEIYTNIQNENST